MGELEKISTEEGRWPSRALTEACKLHTMPASSATTCIQLSLVTMNLRHVVLLRRYIYLTLSSSRNFKCLVRDSLPEPSIFLFRPTIVAPSRRLGCQRTLVGRGCTPGTPCASVSAWRPRLQHRVPKFLPPIRHATVISRPLIYVHSTEQTTDLELDMPSLSPC